MCIESYLLCLLAQQVLATDASLAWSPSPTPGSTNYVLYASTNGLDYVTRSNALAKVNVGLQNKITLYDIAPGIWTFAVTCQKDGLESSFCTPLVVEVPQPPVGLRTVVIENTINLTNWNNVGYFRLKIQ